MVKKNPVFYGWWIVLCFAIINFTMAGNPFPIILKDLMTEFNSGRGLVSLCLSISVIAGGISGLFVGKLIIKHRPRLYLLGGIALGGVAFLALSMAPNLWYAYVFFFIVGVATAGGGVITMFTILSRWFERKWGMAVGLAMAGNAVGGMILSPINGFIVENFGWRATFVFAGLLLLANIPLVFYLVKDSPDEMGLQRDGVVTSPVLSSGAVTEAKPADVSSSVSITGYLKKYQLWLIGLGFALVGMGDNAVVQHQVSFITDMDVSAALASSALGFTLGLSGVGRLVAGWLADRFSSRYVSILFVLVALAGIMILMQANTMSRVWLFVVVYGLGTGASTTMLPLFITDVFGAAGFSILFAVIDVFFKCGMIIGTPMSGFIFDATGSYQRVFFIVAGLYAVGMIFFYLAFGLRPRPLFKNFGK